MYPSSEPIEYAAKDGTHQRHTNNNNWSALDGFKILRELPECLKCPNPCDLTFRFVRQLMRLVICLEAGKIPSEVGQKKCVNRISHCVQDKGMRQTSARKGK